MHLNVQAYNTTMNHQLELSLQYELRQQSTNFQDAEVIVQVPTTNHTWNCYLKIPSLGIPSAIKWMGKRLLFLKKASSNSI